MNRHGNPNLGDEIKNIVQDALNNKDFNRLNRDIENVVKGALDEVKKSINRKQGSRNWSNRTWSSQTGKADEYQQLKKQADNHNTMSNYNNIYKGNDQRKPVPKSTKLTVPMGHVSSILFTVFGIIGSTAFGIAVAVLTLLGYVIGRGIFHTIAMGLFPCFIVCVILSINGSRIRKRLKRFQRYISKMNGRDYSLIKDLSSATGLSEKSTVKDLRKMIAIGMFPEGHIDDKKTCFMLNNALYIVVDV